MRDISDSGICVVVPLQLAAGAIVRLDVADSVLFGVVMFAVPEDADWRTGIEVQRVLLGESELSDLLHEVLQRALPAVAVGPRS